jgi:hypothetical protein
MKVLNSSKHLLVKYGECGIVHEGKLVGRCTHIVWAPSGTASAASKKHCLAVG